MQAGKLNHRITIQQPTKVYESGEQLETWTTMTTVWANLKPMVSDEFEKTEVKFQASTHYEVTIRHLSTVTPEDRFICDGETYHIFGVIHTNEDKKQTMLYCKKAI